MTSATRPAGPARPDRRAHPRLPAAAVPYLQARLAGGAPVTLFDLSKRGVRIGTKTQLLPGRTVVIRFLSGEAVTTMTSAAVRSSVAAVESSGEVTYHVALAFTDELTLCAELDEVAAAVDSTMYPDRVPIAAPEDYTLLVLDGRPGAFLPLDAGEAR